MTDKQLVENMISKKIDEGKKRFGNEFEFMLLEILGLQKLLAPEPSAEPQDREIPLTKWNDYYPDPTVKALRMLVFRKDENGFKDVITRRGNRILIKEKAYFTWRKLHGKDCA